MAELTFYPSIDGYCAHQDGEPGLTWAAMRGGVGNYQNSTSNHYDVSYFQSKPTTNYWSYMTRGILTFDVSAVPSGATITAAILTVHGLTKEDSLGISPTLNIYEASPASTSALANGDFDSLGTTPLCDTAITYSGFATGGGYTVAPNNFTINAAGITLIESAIVGSGFISIGLRNVNYDVDNVAPAWSAIKITGMGITSINHNYVPRHPKLVVTFTGTVGYGSDVTFTTIGTTFPTEAITRVTNIIHRYDRRAGIYSLETNLGEVTTDFADPSIIAQQRISDSTAKIVLEILKEQGLIQ